MIDHNTREIGPQDTNGKPRCRLTTKQIYEYRKSTIDFWVCIQAAWVVCYLGIGCFLCFATVQLWRTPDLYEVAILMLLPCSAWVGGCLLLGQVIMSIAWSVLGRERYEASSEGLFIRGTICGIPTYLKYYDSGELSEIGVRLRSTVGQPTDLRARWASVGLGERWGLIFKYRGELVWSLEGESKESLEDVAALLKGRETK